MNLIHGAHHGDIADDDWLLLVEDDGPTGLGRVIGYFVFTTEADAQRNNMRVGILCEALGLYTDGEDLPVDIQTEIMTYKDFRDSYGNRMPLRNRGLKEA